MDEAWLTSALASDATGGQGVLPEWIRPLQPGRRIVGTATTCEVSAGDNKGLRDALARGPHPGDVLVVTGSSESPTAIMGGLVAEALGMNGFRAVVTDGLVRDSNELSEHVKVWCRGTTPRAGAKKGPGSVGGAVLIGGVTIHPGDLVVCDDDGVVVWPTAAIATLRAKARERDSQDTARAANLRRTGRLD
jgi:4-hydroxy-4-methyl-2-oxoglutarate aldolase